MEKKLCELFAGVGGFRLGLESADSEWETVFASQWEPGKKNQYAFDCYERHFGKSVAHSNVDIGQVTNIPDHTLLVGGFPCQDYSVARTRAEGIHGRKGVLWWEIKRILEKNRPEFVLLENVDRLLKSPTSQRGRDFGVILACLNSLDYYVQWRVINAADYGFVQRRRRVFIFAAHKRTQFFKRTLKSTSLELLSEKGFFENEFPVELVNINESVFPDIKTDEDILNISEHFKFSFENSGLLVGDTLVTAKTSPRFIKPKMLREILEEDVDEKYYLNKNIENWEYLKGAKRIQRRSKEGHEYCFTEGAVPFPDFLDRPARTMLTSEGKRNRSTHVIEDPQTGRKRLLTPIECERIDGFDDNWTEGMPESFRYFCMGNALVVGLITKMGNELNRIYAEENAEVAV